MKLLSIFLYILYCVFYCVGKNGFCGGAGCESGGGGGKLPAALKDM